MKGVAGDGLGCHAAAAEGAYAPNPDPGGAAGGGDAEVHETPAPTASRRAVHRVMSPTITGSPLSRPPNDEVSVSV
jgi:hypothetical protein